METTVEARSGGRVIDPDADKRVIFEFAVLKIRPVQAIADKNGITRQQVYRILKRNRILIVKKPGKSTRLAGQPKVALDEV